MAVDYDRILRNYEKGIDVDMSSRKRKATQLKQAQASAAGLSSASVGTDLTDYFGQLESSAMAQKDNIRQQFAMMKAQEQARIDAEKRMRRAQSAMMWQQALGGILGQGAGILLGNYFSSGTPATGTPNVKYPEMPSFPDYINPYQNVG